MDTPSMDTADADFLKMYIHRGRDLRKKLNEYGNTSTNDQQLVHFNVEKFLNN